MKRLLLFACLLACERRSSEKPPTPPGPRDAQVDVLVDAAPDPAMIAALDRLYEYVATSQRKRSPIEADDQLTNAYREWIFAYGYARAGKSVRTEELVMTAKSRLAGVETDPVHAFLGAAYAERIAIALAGKPPTTAWSPGLEATYAQLDRMEHYKVDRLRESSRVLGVNEAVDAIGAFSRRRLEWRGSDFVALRGITDPAARAMKLVAILDDVKIAEERGLTIVGVLGECSQLPAQAAKHVLAKAITRIDEVPADERVVVYARAIEVAHSIDRARLPDLVAKIGPTFAEASVPVSDALASLVRTLGKTHREEMKQLWAQVESRPITARDVRAMFAAGLVQLGDPRGKPMFDELVKACLEDEMIQTERLHLVRALAVAAAQLPSAERFAAVETLAKVYPRITDSFSTNSHFALSVLELFDALVVGVVDE